MADDKHETRLHATTMKGSHMKKRLAVLLTACTMLLTLVLPANAHKASFRDGVATIHGRNIACVDIQWNAGSYWDGIIRTAMKNWHNQHAVEFFEADVYQDDVCRVWFPNFGNVNIEKTVEVVFSGGSIGQCKVGKYWDVEYTYPRIYIYFNEMEKTGCWGKGTTQKTETVVHELGHALNFKHNSEPCDRSIMQEANQCNLSDRPATPYPLDHDWNDVCWPHHPESWLTGSSDSEYVNCWNEYYNRFRRDYNYNNSKAPAQLLLQLYQGVTQ